MKTIYKCLTLATTALLLSVASRPMLAETPGVKIRAREGWSTFFGGQEASLHFLINSEKPLDGRLAWNHSVQRRTIASGEAAVKIDGAGQAEVEISLRLPEVRGGVIFDTDLALRVIDSRGKVIAGHDRVLRLFPASAFAGRQEWLRGLKITLYDPAGETRRVLDEADVEYRDVNGTSALERTTEGTVLIGEGVSWRDHRGLPGAVEKLAAGGMAVICLAPADGEFDFPGTAENRPRPKEIAFLGTDVIGQIDKRLDADAWPPDGQVIAARLSVGAARKGATIVVDDSGRGWPWLEVVYPGGGRLIVCGFGVVGHWDAGPTPRWLLLRILERVAQDADKPVISREKE